MPSYPGTVLPIHDHPAWKHLSGTSMETTSIKEPGAQKKCITQKKEPVAQTKGPDVLAKETEPESFVFIPTEDPALNKSSDIITSIKCSSYASTTKSQLRHANQQLFEMLQNIQAELATHRAIMLDVQSRLSLLEQDAPTMVGEIAPEILSPAEDLKPPQRPPPPPPRRVSSLIPPGRESQSWWQACQNFAENCDTPFSAQEFLNTPGQFEDFNFHFGGLTSDEDAPATIPIETEDTSAPMTGSIRQSSEDEGSRPASIFSEGVPRSSGLTMDTCEEPDNIIEQIVEFKKPTALPPLLLHPPPSGTSASVLSVEEITALPDIPPPSEVSADFQRHRKGIRSISSKWASLKGKSTDSNEFRKGFFSMR